MAEGASRGRDADDADLGSRYAECRPERYRLYAAVLGLIGGIPIAIAVVCATGVADGGIPLAAVLAATGVLPVYIAFKNVQLGRAAGRMQALPNADEQLVICASGRLTGFSGLVARPFLLAATTHRLIVMEAGAPWTTTSIPYAELEEFVAHPRARPTLHLRGAGLSLVLTAINPATIAPLTAVVGERARGGASA